LKKINFLSTFLVSFLAIVGFLYAQESTPTSTDQGVSKTKSSGKHKKEETVSTALVATPTASPTDTPSPRWVAPPVLDDASKIVKYQINSVLQNDVNGTNVLSLIDLSFKRRMDQYNVGAEGDVRFGKDFSNSYSAETIDVRSAKLIYAKPFLTFSAGRMDVGGILSPMNFFGNYSTMGLRRVDGLQITVPITLSFGVVDYDKWVAPPTALSLFYIPSITSAQFATYDTTQSLFIGQLRVSSKLAEIPFTLRFNMGQSAADYFTYSSLSKNLFLDAGLNFTVDKDYDFYGEFGVQNSNLFNQTDAFSFGLKAKELYTFGPLSFDELTLEMQVPLAQSLYNPFIGGNGFSLASATTPQNTFMAHLKARFEAIFLNFYITNTPGDFTFARINSGNSALSLNTPFGLGNEVEGLGVPLVSSSYSNFSYIFTMGVEF